MQPLPPALLFASGSTVSPHGLYAPDVADASMRTAEVRTNGRGAGDTAITDEHEPPVRDLGGWDSEV